MYSCLLSLLYPIDYCDFIINIILIVEEVIQYENYDLESIVTPVNADAFNRLLKEAGYNNRKRNYLHRGFSRGFAFHYQGLGKLEGLHQI